jgi:hypothetical protein
MIRAIFDICEKKNELLHTLVSGSKSDTAAPRKLVAWRSSRNVLQKKKKEKHHRGVSLGR